MLVQEVCDAGAGHDDAGERAAGEQDAQAAGLQMEGGGGLAAGERVPDEGDVELTALETVGSVHGISVRRHSSSCARTASAWTVRAAPIVMWDSASGSPFTSAPHSNSRAAVATEDLWPRYGDKRLVTCAVPKCQLFR